MVHAAPTGLLIGAEDYAYSAAKGNAGSFDCCKRIDGSDSRALIIHGAAAEDFAVGNLCGIGGMYPAFALGNDIEMPDDAEHFITFAEVDAAGVSVKIGRFEAEAFAELQCMLKRITDGSTEGRTLACRGSFDARKTNALAHGFDQLILMNHYIVVNSIIHNVPFLPPKQYSQGEHSFQSSLYSRNAKFTILFRTVSFFCRENRA